MHRIPFYYIITIFLSVLINKTIYFLLKFLHLSIKLYKDDPSICEHHIKYGSDNFCNDGNQSYLQINLNPYNF
jgi:hypothetical protein